MAKRLTMMILRNILRVPYILFRLFQYAKATNVSEEKNTASSAKSAIMAARAEMLRSMDTD